MKKTQTLNLLFLTLGFFGTPRISHAFVVEGAKLKALKTVHWMYGTVPYFSHEKITRYAIWQTMVEEIEPQYFSWSMLNQDWFYEISRANEEVDDDQKSSEKHYDNGKFLESHNRLSEKRREIHEAISKGDIHLARKLLGQALHTVQDFYSHTNWVTIRKLAGSAFIEEYPCQGCSKPPQNIVPVVKLKMFYESGQRWEVSVTSGRYNGKHDVKPGSHCVESQDFPLPITDSANFKEILFCPIAQATWNFETLPQRHYGAGASAIVASMKYIRETMTLYEFEYLTGNTQCYHHPNEWKPLNSGTVFHYYCDEAEKAYEKWNRQLLRRNDH